MKFIITENQQEKLIQQLVKSGGYKTTLRIIGSPEKVIELGFNNDPNEFIRMFDNMEVRKLKSTLWVYSLNGRNIMLYNPRKKEVFVDYNDFFEPLYVDFNLEKDVIREITKNWLLEKYKIKVDKINFNPINQSL